MKLAQGDFPERARFGLSLCLTLFFAAFLAGCDRAGPMGFRSGSPLGDLPPWITSLQDFGVRPDWSGDSARLVYLDALVGNVFEVELATGSRRSLTEHFPHHGFTRARYLANGALLLCGPGSANPDREGVDAVVGAVGDRWHTELFYLPLDGGPAQPLEEPCFEGPAVSRLGMTIAWTRSDYPEELLFARSEIWTGRIEVQDGRARIVDRRRRVGREDFYYLAFLETQDFRPPDDSELLFSAYAYKGGEVMGVDLNTGALTNYSQDWGYDEAEGVFPDGESIAIEREANTYTAVPVGDIDIWQLSLDGTAEVRRLTNFTDYAGYGANNPVISPDGKKMVFGLRIKGGDHGNADGMLLYDFEAARQARSETQTGAAVRPLSSS
jgi:hypothetical protein